MKRSETTAFFFGVLAALLWSPHFYLATGGSGRHAMIVFHFYMLLWAGAFCMLLLLLTGRLGELSVFKRRETQFLLLVLTGGYGLWLLRALAISRGAGNLGTVHVLLYTGPLALGVLSMLTREPPTGRQFIGLILGLVGCIMIVGRPAGGHGGTAGFSASLLALGAALCWALFALAARSLVREEKLLPLSAVLWSAGAVCMFVTAISTGENILQITPKDLLLSMFLGAVTIAMGYACWLKCLEASSFATAGALWYLALVLGVGWHKRAGLPVNVWTLGGVLLVLAAVCGSAGGRRARGLTLSDVIRA